jgi:PAS domain S-box-containing protein
MTIGRSFLLWLLGVLVVTLVLVSALVLWHERGILDEELEGQARLLARTLAVATAQGGAPEYLAVASLSDLRAGEVQGADGRVLWRYGPSLAEASALEADLLRVEERVTVPRPASDHGDDMHVVLLVSRGRMDRHLAASAVRLVTALGVALGLALLVGMDLVSRVAKPLRALSEHVRTFDPEGSQALAPAGGAAAGEVRDLAQAFNDMASRLAEQRRFLIANEQRYRDLFESSPTPLLELDRALSIRGANPAATSFLGCAPAAAVGRAVTDFVDQVDTAGLADAATSSGTEGVVEARWLLPGGELAEVELHIRKASEPAEAGYLMAIHDLTDRVRRLGELWRRTFDAMVDGVALVDPSGEIVLANQALGRHLESLRPSVREQLGEGDGAGWRVMSGGRLLECMLSSPLELDHAILVARDVTEAVRTENRLREAEKMEAVATLASGLAHDFNNLLAAIQLHVRWLLREPESLGEAATAIRDLAEEGAEVVGELLLFARRESTPPRTVDLRLVVTAQEAMLRRLMPEGVDLVVVAPRRPVAVTANPAALRRLLLNLVLNARDAVADRAGTVKVTISVEGERAALEVADDGPGIPPEHRSHLFEPFFTGNRRGRGAGLGLAVVYAIVTDHGGEIDVSSDHKGSRFVVRLPLAADEDLEEPAHVAGEARAEAGGRRVLLVDDDGREAARLLEALAVDGLEVRHATTLEAARQVAAEWSPTALVTVTELPDGSAQPLAAQLGVPTVMLADDPDTVSPMAPPAEVLARAGGVHTLCAAIARATRTSDRGRH